MEIKKSTKLTSCEIRGMRRGDVLVSSDGFHKYALLCVGDLVELHEGSTVNGPNFSGCWKKPNGTECRFSTLGGDFAWYIIDRDANDEHLGLTALEMFEDAYLI